MNEEEHTGANEERKKERANFRFIFINNKLRKTMKQILFNRIKILIMENGSNSNDQ